MAEYRLEVKRPASKELARLPPNIGKTLLAAVVSLSSEPRPRQSHKLAASFNSYRVRVGDYRILYQIDDDSKSVTVFKISHRRDVYR